MQAVEPCGLGFGGCQFKIHLHNRILSLDLLKCELFKFSLVCFLFFVLPTEATWEIK